jgi:hypothetical protein
MLEGPRVLRAEQRRPCQWLENVARVQGLRGREAQEAVMVKK